MLPYNAIIFFVLLSNIQEQDGGAKYFYVYICDFRLHAMSAVDDAKSHILLLPIFFVSSLNWKLYAM